jgi:hypothetical protein
MVGINLTQLASNTSSVKVEIGGQMAVVDYRPNYLTADNISKFGNVESVDDMDSYMTFMAEVIADWELSEDVTDDKGKTVEKHLDVTAPNMRKIPLQLIGKIMEAIVSDTGQVSPEAVGSFAAG